MAWKLTIAGVDYTELVRVGDGFSDPTFSFERNVRGQLTFDIEGEPGKRAVVIAYAKDGVTKVFGGLVMRRDPIDVPPGADYCTRCECADFSTYADWAAWTRSYTSDQTLKQVLTDLVSDKLSAYGIALDSGQVDGPTIPSGTSWTKRRCSDVLRDLVEQTGLMYRIDPDLRLKMFAPGTDAAPVDLAEGDNLGAVTWSDSTEIPANTVICEFGPSAPAEREQMWTADGVATSWVVDVDPLVGGPTRGYVTVDGVAKTLGSGAQFEWDDTTGTLSVGTDTTPTAGQVISLFYTAQFPFTITKTNGDTPAIEKYLAFDTITDFAQADAIATQQLAVLDQEPRVFTSATLEDGFAPGQTSGLDAPSRGISSVTQTITRVEATLHTDLFWEYTITGEETDILTPDYLTKWRRLTGTSNGGSVSAGILSTVTVTTLSAPYPLGGSDQASVVVANTTPVDVSSYHPFIAPANMTARVRGDVWTRDGSAATLSLYCEDDNTTVATSPSHSSSTRASGAITPFLAVLEEGKSYRLQRAAGAGKSVYGIGRLEAA